MVYRNVTFLDRNYNTVLGDIETENGIVTSLNIKGEGRGEPVLPPFTFMVATVWI